MPPISRWFIRTSFVYLAIGLAAGVLLAGRSVWHLPAFLASFFPAYIHMITVGWMTQLIFGVAYWMFPKYTLEKPHGNDALNWSAYFLLNAGLLLRLLAEPLIAGAKSPPLAVLLVVSAALQWLGGMVFLVNLWRRVKVK